MDIIEINKLTRKKNIETALQHIGNLTQTEAVILLLDALKKEYGTIYAVKILHSIGIKKIDLSV